MICRALALGSLLVVSGAARAQEPTATLPHAQALLQGLDKVTARVSEVPVPVDQQVRFGTLEITARACMKAPPTETPESAAFLEVRDVGPSGDGGGTVFSGWMFASSPALSALEHPVYDVWVVDCVEPLPDPAMPEASLSPAPAPQSPRQNN